MNAKNRCAGAAIAAAILIVTASAAQAESKPDETFNILTTISIPETTDTTCPSRGAELKAFDISWVDPVLGLYLLADRTNCSLDVIDTTTNTVLRQIGGFIGASPGGFDVSGPDGVLTIHHNEAWVGDGDSTVKVVNPVTGGLLYTISTGGSKRADEMAWDPRDEIFVVANDADNPPFLTFISTESGHAVLGHLKFDGSSAPNATGGLEQPVWSAATGLFYLSVPEVNHTGQGEITVIDPKSEQVVDDFPVSCQPAGLALGPENFALVGCSDAPVQIINIRSGATVGRTPDFGYTDEVWYNPGDGHYFGAAGNNVVNAAPAPVLGIIDAQTKKSDENVPTTIGDHSVAADLMTNHVFLPDRKDALCPNGCVVVFEPSSQDTRHGHLFSAGD